MVDIYDVKRRIAEILGSDGGLRSVMGNDLIFLGWPLGEHIKPPFITITDVYWRGEISGLGILSSRSEICHATLQIDVWANSEGLRDRISEAVRGAILRALEILREDGIVIGAPSVSAINEVRRGVFRHSLRYPITYEVYAHV